jgi:ribosomal protein L37AE/L43A
MESSEEKMLSFLEYSLNEGVEPEKSKKPVIHTADGVIHVKDNKGETVARFHHTPKGLEYANQFVKQNKHIWEDAVAEGSDPFVSNWNKSVASRINKSNLSPDEKKKLFLKLQRSKSATDAELIHQHLDKQGVAEGNILKSIKRGLQGWDKSAVGPAGEKIGDPQEIVRRNKSYDDETLKVLHKAVSSKGPGFPFNHGSIDPKGHSPASLQKRVLDREMRRRGLDEQGVAEANPKDKIKDDDKPFNYAEWAKSGKKPRALPGWGPKGFSTRLFKDDPKVKKDKDQGVAEAAKWRRDDLKGKTWRSKDWDDGELSPDMIQIDRSGKDVDDYGDELKARPGAWGGKYKRMTKKGTPTQAELGMQNNLKMRMKTQQKQGGLTGPKGKLPEEAELEEAKRAPKSTQKDSEKILLTCPRCGSADVKTYSDGEKKCNSCGNTWDVKK